LVFSIAHLYVRKRWKTSTSGNGQGADG